MRNILATVAALVVLLSANYSYAEKFFEVSLKNVDYDLSICSSNLYEIQSTSYVIKLGYGCLAPQLADKAVIEWHGKGSYRNKLVTYRSKYDYRTHRRVYEKDDECRIEKVYVIFEADLN